MVASYLNFAAVLVYFFLTWYILQRNRKELLCKVASLTMLCFALWGVPLVFIHNPFFNESYIEFAIKAGLSANYFQGSLLLLLVAIFTEKKRLQKSIPILIFLFLIPVLQAISLFYFDLISIEKFENNPGWNIIWHENAISVFFGVIYYLIVTTAFILLFLHYFKAKSKVRKKQIIVILVTGVLSYLLGMLNLIFIEYIRMYLTNFFIVFLAFGITYVLSNYEEAFFSVSKALNKIPEIMTDAMLITDWDSHVRITNKAFQKYTGFKESEIKGQTVNTFFNENPDVILKGAQQIESMEISLQTKNGEIPVLLSGSVLFNENNGKIGCLYVLHDITARKKMELKIKQANELLEKKVEERTALLTELNTELQDKIKRVKQFAEESKLARTKAEESDQLKSFFLANMSHEIRTPLNGILGFANLLEQKNLSGDKQQSYVKVIKDCGNQLLLILTDILDLSKIESNSLEITMQDCNLTELIDNLENLFKNKINLSGKSIELKKEAPGGILICKTDSQHIRQIFNYLFDNSLKFTKKGCITFGFSLSTCNEEHHREIKFYVKDTGIGIDSEKLELIFESFRQSDESATRRYGGAGLGLAISKGLINLLNGKIHVESEPGQGAAFYFSIPYVAPENDILE